MPSRLSRAAASCAAVLLLACSGDPQPNLIVVVVDTLRADRLGVYGNERGLTPFMDSLAARGVLFRRATAPSSWTIPSIATLFTSRHASQHRVVAFESILDASEVTLGERLHEAGYATGGFTSNFRLSREHGYAQGFETWGDRMLGKIRAGPLNEKAFRWASVVGVRRPDAPVFLYMHYMEPHSPYEPPDPFRKRFASPQDHARIPKLLNKLVTEFHWQKIDEGHNERLRGLYDGEVAAMDDGLAKLFEGLDARGLLDDAFVVVTSDHGEEFGEHGSYLHGRTLYEHTVRVPLILVPPARYSELRGVVVDDPVSLIDVAPTLLELLGQSPEPRFEGRSLLPLIQGAEAARDVRLELLRSSDDDKRLHRGGLVRGQTKLLLDPEGTPAVFDLAADPGERNPEDGSPVAAELVSVFENDERELASRSIEDPETGEIDAETRERLKALGYIAD